MTSYWRSLWPLSWMTCSIKRSQRTELSLEFIRSFWPEKHLWPTPNWDAPRFRISCEMREYAELPCIDEVSSYSVLKMGALHITSWVMGKKDLDKWLHLFFSTSPQLQCPYLIGGQTTFEGDIVQNFNHDLKIEYHIITQISTSKFFFWILLLGIRTD